MEDWKPGDRIWHPAFGLGIVVERPRTDLVDVLFHVFGRKRLSLLKAPVSRPTAEQEDALAPGGKAYRQWLDDTFLFEGTESKHFPGNRWNPFFDDVTTLVERFSEILPKSLSQISYAETKPPIRSLPPEWPKAKYLCWPTRRNGIAFVLVKKDEDELLESFFPFDHAGVQHQLEIDKINVWNSGVEAQIECNLGNASISFFDTLYAENRGWYEAGEVFQFLLSAIAYDCRRAEDKVLKALNTIDVHTKGMAALLPVKEWDRDDYWFHGPVIEVKEMTMLDQPAWRVRTTVLCHPANGREINFNIIVTRKVWGDAPPPQPGDDIEGTLWLQGFLWLPGENWD